MVTLHIPGIAFTSSAGSVPLSGLKALCRKTLQIDDRHIIGHNIQGAVTYLLMASITKVKKDKQ
jgi:hypothetical protein